MVFSALWFLVSLFMLYQGLSYSGFNDLPVLVFDKFLSNNYLILLREVLIKYMFILSGVGMIASLIFMVWIYKDKEDCGFTITASMWGILVFYVLISLFTVI